MKRTLIRYTTSTAMADKNAELIASVFVELKAAKPEGVLGGGDRDAGGQVPPLIALVGHVFAACDKAAPAAERVARLRSPRDASIVFFARIVRMPTPIER